MHFLRNILHLSSPDIVLITETWCSAEMSDTLFRILGYNIFRNDRLYGRGGGCIIYVKDKYLVLPLNEPLLRKLPDSVWITISINPTNLLVGCIYRPPSSTLTVTDDLLDTFSFIADLSYTNKIIAGDFNMPEIPWSLNNKPQKHNPFMSTLGRLGWVQHVTEPTRLGNTLDLIFTMGCSHVSTYISDKLPGSDHNIVGCSFQILSKPIESVINYRPFSSVNWSIFSDLIRSSYWDPFFLAQNVQIACNEFYHRIQLCVEAVAPERTKKLKRTAAPAGISKKVATKLHKIKKKFRKTNDFTLLMLHTRLLTALYQDHHKMLCSEEVMALKGANVVGCISKLLDRRQNRKSSCINTIVNSDGTAITDRAIICSIFNDYFMSTYSTNANEDPQLKLIHRGRNTLQTVEFTLSDICRQLRLVRPSCSPGPDNIPPILVKHGGPDIPLFLLNVFTLSMLNGEYPIHWKQSTIIPRHKSGSMQDVKNYRPIHHTSIISRIMERIVKERIIEYLSSMSLLSKHQHGFLKGRSCTTCQLDYLDYVTRARDAGSAIIVIFLDIQKAFDRVPHNLLLRKLMSYGITNSLLDWLSSYLEGRKQVVKIGNYTSEATTISSGVIQGSVLGPLLFLIYFNDLLDEISYGKPFLFADDVKIVYCSAPGQCSPNLAYIQSDLSALELWSNSWKLHFATDKSNLLYHGCGPSLNILTLNDTPIPVCGAVRDLGLRYSASFNF
ncbi:unnamed protein product [Dicrocoelium dendriticum]|nr:unnamed protein product [Dicrocoelium dendriticum]